MYYNFILCNNERKSFVVFVSSSCKLIAYAPEYDN
jgi:hypothetical protein